MGLQAIFNEDTTNSAGETSSRPLRTICGLHHPRFSQVGLVACINRPQNRAYSWHIGKLLSFYKAIRFVDAE